MYKTPKTDTLKDLNEEILLVSTETLKDLNEELLLVSSVNYMLRHGGEGFLALIAEVKRSVEKLEIDEWNRNHNPTVTELDAPVHDDDGETLIDFIESDAPRPEDTMVQHNRRAIIESLLKELRPREAEIIARRFGLWGTDPQTLEEIAGGEITRERVRQIEAIAIRKLRHKMRIRGITFSEL